MNQNQLQEIRDLVHLNKITLDKTFTELGKITNENLALYEDTNFFEILNSLKQVNKSLNNVFNKIIEIYKKTQVLNSSNYRIRQKSQ